jgi:hypothetical protein
LRSISFVATIMLFGMFMFGVCIMAFSSWVSRRRFIDRHRF